MKWNVFYHNINSGQIEVFNIFGHYSFRHSVEEHLKKCADKNDFERILRIELMFYFWSKCEWETVIKPWISGSKGDDGIKVDIYWQVMNNWDIFLDYTWSFKDA